MPQKALYSFSSPSPRVARLISTLAVFLLATLDFIGGTRISLVLFTALPIVYVSWFDGRKYGLLLAVASVILFTLEGFKTGFISIHGMNVLIYAVALTGVAFLTDSLRRWHTARLAEVENRYTRVVEAAIEGIVATNTEWEISFANKRAASLFGETSEQLLGKNLLELLHDHAERNRLCERTIEFAMPSGPLELEFTKKGGGSFWALVTFTPTKSFAGRQDGMILLLTDISELKHSERELDRRYQEISAMQRLSSGLSQSLDLAARLENAVDTVLDVTGFDAGSIFLLDETRNELQMQYHRGFVSEEFLNRAKKWPIGKGATGQTARTGIPYFMEDAIDNPVMDQQMRALEGVRAFASIPLLSKEKVQGVLNIMARRPFAFTPGDQMMLQTLGKQIGISLENARLYEMAQQRERQVRRLSIDIVQVQEEERRRFARELHDGLSQLLTTLKINSELAMKNSDTDIAAAQKHLKEVIALANEAQMEAKQIAYDLRPAILDDFGLKAAIGLHATNFERRTGIVVDLHMPPSDIRFGSLIETTLYRIVQELLTNVAKHAKASRVTLQMLVRNDVLALFVADNGKGFETSKTFSAYAEQPRYGLRNVRERVEFLGGMFRAESSSGRGSEFMIELPVREETAPMQLKEKAV